MPAGGSYRVATDIRDTLPGVRIVALSADDGPPRNWTCRAPAPSATSARTPRARRSPAPSAVRFCTDPGS